MQRVIREATHVIALSGQLYRELAFSAFSLLRPRG